MISGINLVNWQLQLQIPGLPVRHIRPKTIYAAACISIYSAEHSLYTPNQGIKSRICDWIRNKFYMFCSTEDN